MDYSIDLVLGDNINFKDICTIFQPTVAEIKETIGYEQYEKLLTPYIISKESLNITDDNISNFDLLYYNLYNEEGNVIDVFELFRQSLSFFCKEENILINEETLEIVIDEDINRTINSNNFEEFAEIILRINSTQRLKISKPPEKKEKRDIWEKLNKGRKRKEEKSKNNINFATMINMVKFGMDTYITKEQIKEMTIWELHNAYNNIINKESYKSNFDIYLVAGSKDLDLTHWSSKTIN